MRVGCGSVDLKTYFTFENTCGKMTALNDGVIGVAVLGLGRAGSIHFRNCHNNARACVRYLVDTDVEKCKDLVAKHTLKEAVALKPEQIDQAVGKSLKGGYIGSYNIFGTMFVRVKFTYLKTNEKKNRLHDQGGPLGTNMIFICDLLTTGANIHINVIRFDHDILIIHTPM